MLTMKFVLFINVILLKNIHTLNNENDVITHLPNFTIISNITKQSLVNQSVDEFTPTKSWHNEIPPPFFGLNLQKEALKISKKLLNIANEELGYFKLQSNMDSYQYYKIYFNMQGNLEEMTNKLKKKILSYNHLLGHNIKILNELYNIHLESSLAHTHPCYTISPDKFRYEEDFGTEINLDYACDLLPPFPVLSMDMFMPGTNISEFFRKNYYQNPSIKWQYFISSTTGIHTQYPAMYKIVDNWGKKHFMRHEQVFLSTIYPQKKNIIILLDHGNSLSNYQLQMGKSLAIHILSFLTIHDKVAVIGIEGEVSFPHSKMCDLPLFDSASLETKIRFKHFIENLSISSNYTNHQLGFTTSFHLLHSSLDFNILENEVLIAYISRGLLMSITDAKPLMETIVNYNAQLNNKIIINTFILMEAGKPIMYEEVFLHDIAEQRFTKYNIKKPIPEQMPPKHGKMIVVNSIENHSNIMIQFFSSLDTHKNNNVSYSLPSWDASDKAVLSFASPVYHNETLLGVVGLDINLEELIDDLLFYGQNSGNYAFLVDISGLVLVHPLLQNHPNTHLTDILYLENKKGFNKIRNSILNEKFGHRELASMVLKFNATSVYKKVSTVYIWKRIPGTCFILCLVSEESKPYYSELQNVDFTSSSRILYHRLDIDPNDSLCRYFKSVATLESSTIFLSSRSFSMPYKFLTEKETRSSIQGYLAYLHDKLNLLASPGLKPEIKNHVFALSSITSYWLDRVNSVFNRFVVRRYSASRSGVMVVYPGTLLDKNFDPTTREWFNRAMVNPGKVVLSAPYLDLGGAGYIVTISCALLKERDATKHSGTDKIIAVMGMDLTLGFYQKMLLDSISLCREDKMSCFLMDERGYLIIHPGLIDPSGQGPVEQQHITHKEPLVSCDLLNNKDIFEKKLCHNFQDRTTQRFYQVNTTLENVLSNQVPGETCSKYQLTKVPGTNLFLAIVNQTCDAVTAFCPCSLIDRLCLNCQRMEQTECECPCECPMEICSSRNRDVPTCPKYLKEPPVQIAETSINLELLPDCFKTECNIYLKDIDCMGIVGCEWCHTDNDGVTPLKKKKCIEQYECFGGILGARSPYTDERIGHPSNNYFIKSTPVGPVAGGIMAVFLTAAIGIICYRHFAPRSHSFLTTHEDSHRIPHNDIDDLVPYDEPTMPIAFNNIRLLEIERVSPYRVNPGYRRPPPTTESSDHGYSTMTPHDDSEHLSTIEPLIQSPPDIHPVKILGLTMEAPPSGSKIQVQVHVDAF